MTLSSHPRCIQLSDSPRRRFPLEKWAPAYVWAKSLLTFGQRHLNRCHYGDTPPPLGATAGSESQWESGRATGLSFLGIIRAKIAISPLAPRGLGPALPGGQGTESIFRKPGYILRGYVEILHSHRAHTGGYSLRDRDATASISCLRRELSRPSRRETI